MSWYLRLPFSVRANVLTVAPCYVAQRGPIYTERARGDGGHISERPQRSNELRLPHKLSLFTSDLPLIICP